jgi:integrase
MRTFRQVLDAAVGWRLMRENPARLAGPNPQTPPPEVVPFTRDELDRVADEAGSPHAELIVFAAETGLRPSEWLALEHRIVLASERVVMVERTFSDGRERNHGKTSSSRRRVPLSRRALEAYAAAPRRMDSRLVWPADRGGHLDLHNWRARVWRPALDAAGVAPRRPYDLRHTFATNALAARLTIFELARYMGTSVAMIDRAYGHLACGNELDAARRLDECAGPVPRVAIGN